MLETKDWFETELPRLAGVHKFSQQNVSGVRLTTASTYAYSEIKLSDCVWAWTEDDTADVATSITGAKHYVTHERVSVPLKDLDLASIVAVEDRLATDEPKAVVKARAIASAGKSIRHSISDSTASVDALAFYFRRLEDASRLGNALTRAAELCGAKRSPF
jgi:hypothetical protein